MPLYQYLCPNCQREDEDFRKMNQNSATKWCACGKLMRKVPSLPRTERQFAGSESWSTQQGFHPKEVARARKLLGGKYDSNIHDSGRVQFSSRSEERAFARDLENLETRIEAKAITLGKMKNLTKSAR